MNNTRYELYRFLRIFGITLLIASIITHTFWASCVAGFILFGIALVDIHIIKTFHAGLHAKDDILNNYVEEVSKLKSELAEVYARYDILEENASDILDAYADLAKLDETQRAEYYQKIYLEKSDGAGA